ncbi:MAG: hypothetical protein KO464_01535 [Candidatus Methanofastidiosum sp.]|nr:hypothetical protein [Methanofastidiosum sp.]
MFAYKKIRMLEIIPAILGTIIFIYSELLNKDFWQFYNEIKLLFFIVTGVVIYSIFVKIYNLRLKEKHHYVELPFSFAPFIYLTIKYAIIKNYPINYLVPLQGFSLALIYLSFGNDTFQYFWKNNTFKLKTYWENLSLKQVSLLKKYLIHILIIVFVLHLFLIFIKIDLLSFHHLYICVLIFILIISYKRNKSNLEIENYAEFYFHICIIFALYDILLVELDIFEGGIFYYQFFGPLIPLLFYFAFRPRIGKKEQ